MTLMVAEVLQIYTEQPSFILRHVQVKSDQIPPSYHPAPLLPSSQFHHHWNHQGPDLILIFGTGGPFFTRKSAKNVVEDYSLRRTAARVPSEGLEDGESRRELRTVVHSRGCMVPQRGCLQLRMSTEILR